MPNPSAPDDILLAPAQPSVCTCFRARKLARLMTQYYDRALAPAGLNLNQYSILRRANGTRALTEVARDLGMDRTTLTRDLKPLIEAQWLRVEPGPDARQRCIRITDEGKEAVRLAKPLWRQAQDAIENGLGPAELQTLHDHIDRAIDQLQGSTA